MTDRADMKKKNLKAFEARYGELARTLRDYVPQSRLVELDDGGWDTEFAGERFYNGDPLSFIEKQIDRLRTNPRRFVISPPESTSLDKYAGEFVFHTLKRAQEDHGADFLKMPEPGKSFFVIVYGIGLMPFIDDLLEQTDPMCMMFVEPNYEFLYHSLEVFDWVSLFERFAAKGGGMEFSISDNPERISTDIRIWLRSINPCSVDGMTQFMHYNHPVFRRIEQILYNDKNIFLSGLGFFYDETIMIRNCHANLYGGDSRVYLRPNDDPRIDVPVFVIGSGPSIDKDIPFLKANRDKAVYISCGSSIRVLTVNGIVPDFHVEIENINVEPIISQVAKYCDISKVHLVTASTVDQSIMEYFDSVLFYFRASLSPFPIFCETDRQCLLFPSPTVVNAGASFAQEVGFRKIYLFGVDMGTKNRSLHHSKDGYQYTEEHDKLLDAGKWVMPAAYTEPVPGNLGGVAYTSTDLYWAMDMLRILFTRHSRGRTYYNCSDGAYIDGTLPQPSKALKLPAVGAARETAIGRVLDCFPAYSEQRFNEAWQDELFVSSCRNFSTELRKFIEEPENFREKSYLIGFNRFVIQPYGRMAQAMALLFRGTLWQALMAFEFYDLRITDDAHRDDFHAIAKEEMLKVIDTLEEVAVEKLGELTAKAVAGIHVDPLD